MTTTKFQIGQHVKIKDDHWTGMGTQYGIVEAHYPHSGRCYVKFDDKVLCELDDRSLETV